MTFTLPSAKENEESGELPTVAHLTKPQQYQLKALVEKNRVVFSERPGMCNVGKHKITLQEGSEPQRAYPYRVPMAFRREVERQVHELEEWGLVYPVESSHAHPVVCVAKKDGSMRLCIDYRKLNAITKPDAFPMSRASDLLLEVAGANFISILDMLRGYWQIPMDEQAQYYTAFVTPQGQYAWKVMPYGLRNSASTFQRIINQILAPHAEYACAYIDDVGRTRNSSGARLGSSGVRWIDR